MSVGNLTYDGGQIATPSDTVNDPFGPFAAFQIWSAGTVSFLDQLGNNVAASGSMTAGTLIRCKGVRINNTGTTATVLLFKAVA